VPNNSLKRLEGKTALVTGGASGIGRRITGRFVQEGARVVVADISTEGLEEIKRELGSACFTLETDVVREADVERAVAAAVTQFGGLDIAVNSAGTGGLNLIVNYTEDQWDREMDICLKGVFLCLKHQGRQMISQGRGGSIINIASLNARQPAEGMSAYCAAKAGVEMLTKVGAMEMGPHRIRVNCICPGLVDTPLTTFIMQTPSVLGKYLEGIPLGRNGLTDDIAAAAVFLASDDSAWVTADSMFVDGGSQTKGYPPMLKMLTDLFAQGHENAAAGSQVPAELPPES
jgi:NAD(P)-dependent dehydrogenase (short-subunit alcohol dehydrogenase family)